MHNRKPRPGKSPVNPAVVLILAALGAAIWLSAAQAPPPSPSSTPSPPGPVEKTNPVDGARMILVPGGIFYMGAIPGDPLASISEKPLRMAYLEDYYIYKFEVTREQFLLFATKTGYVTTAERKGRRATWRNGLGKDTMSRPVTVVSWEDAQAYCRWAGGHLPTEAQWEKAARGCEKRTYPWGDEMDPSRFKNCLKPKPGGGFDTGPGRDMEEDNFVDFAAPVGSYPLGASPYGVMDMMGNAFEFCGDWSGEYQRSFSRFALYEPFGRPGGTMRVMKGGGDCDDPRNFRISFRDRAEPDEICDDFGMRVAMSREEWQRLSGGEVKKAGEEKRARDVDIILNPRDGALAAVLPSPGRKPHEPGEALQGFYLAPVSREAFDRFRQEEMGMKPPRHKQEGPAMAGRDEAEDYCHWAGGRLPTRDEVEYFRRTLGQSRDFLVKKAQKDEGGNYFDGWCLEDPPGTEGKEPLKKIRVFFSPGELEPAR